MSDKYTPSKGDYIDLKGKKYLPARRRVQWFRGDHPDWTINTSVVDMDFAAGYAVIRAEVSDETGRLIASGMKTETKSGFGDFVEKAETGAIARAVAIAGYGTEDALDLDEGERIADSPVAARSQPERAAGGAPASSPNRPSAQASRSPEEERLRDELLALTNGRGREYLEHLASTVGVPEGQRATAAQLSAMIDLALSEAANEPPLAREGGPETQAPAEEASEVGSPPADPDALPPQPGTPEYRALPNGHERAKAKAYWDARPEPEQETLAEMLGAPA